MRPQLSILILAISVTLPTTTRAAWPLNGTALCTSANDQNLPVAVSDGAGGAIVTWYDSRSGNADIYAQRFDVFGNPLWAANGVALCTNGNDQRDPTIISDGAGGAIVAWRDFRTGANYDVYAQRVNASGVPQWTLGGVALCTAAGDQHFPAVLLYGVGGAIVTWLDNRPNAGGMNIYAQRLSASGVPQWTLDGVALCTAPDQQIYPKIISDGAAGAIVTWHDLRTGVGDIYAQRVNASGIPQWAANGVGVCTDPFSADKPTIVSDDAGGAIITWEDSRLGGDIYAQRMNALGIPQWTADGIAVCAATGPQFSPLIIPDGAGGAIVAWPDYRSSTYDVYAQRVNASGVPQWLTNGVALCTAPSFQERLAIASDGAGGAIATWDETRTTTFDIYAQRVNALGAPLWTANGVAVSSGAGEQQSATIAPDGTGGALIAWNDSRNGNYDIYAQRIEGRYGEFGQPEPAVVSATDNPSDQGGRIILRWSGSGRDRFDDPMIALYSVWRSTDFVTSSAAVSSASADLRVVSDPREIGPDFSGAAIWKEMTPTGPEYWEWIANQGATYQSTYSFTASTRQDSVATNSATHYFKVISHESTSPQTRMWESASVSAHSVDNLAPEAPLLLVAQRVGSDVQLKWNRAVAHDLRDYSIYRATSAGVTPVSINFLANSEDTLAVDASAPVSALYYIVTAHDVHANQSAPSNEASVQAMTGVGNTPSITALTALDNMPNPFTSTTTLRVGLPKASEVEIDVFDVAGRRIRSERTTTLAAGWREISFDARDAAGKALPSGVYFYRVKADGETITRKMVIAR